MEKFIVPRSSFFSVRYALGALVLLMSFNHCSTMPDPAGSAPYVTDVPVPLERSLSSYKGTFENCQIVDQRHVVHFPFVLPLNDPPLNATASDGDSILIKYRAMRWSDIGYTALGFLFGVITDSVVIAECGNLAAAENSIMKSGATLEGNQQLAVFRFHFETGVGDQARSDASMEGLKQRILSQPDARFLIAVSADCEGSAEENQRLMQERADYALRQLKQLGVDESRAEVLYRNLRSCDEGSESRAGDRYVYVIIKEGV